MHVSARYISLCLHTIADAKTTQRCMSMGHWTDSSRRGGSLNQTQLASCIVRCCRWNHSLAILFLGRGRFLSVFTLCDLIRNQMVSLTLPKERATAINSRHKYSRAPIGKPSRQGLAHSLMPLEIGQLLLAFRCSVPLL